MELATTTTHEVQRRGLSEDRHGGASVHEMRESKHGRGEKLRATVEMNGGSVRCKLEVVMKLTSIKAMVAKAMAVGLVAGALVLAAPQKAQAQVRIGVQFGYPPVYAYAPGYAYPSYPPDYYARRDYYERLRCERERQREAWERHEAWERREAWEHAREFDRRHDRDWDRDRR